VNTPSIPGPRHEHRAGRKQGDGLADTSDPATRPCLSFVVPCYNEEENIASTIQEIAFETARLKRIFEIILVDDGSHDRTVDIARAMMTDHPVRILRLSRNFGKEQAISAGMESALGEAVVLLDADLQEPISLLETLLEHWENGYEMIYAVRADRKNEPWLKRGAVRLFYGLLNYAAATDIPRNARDFRLMDRKVVDALNALPERNRFMKGLYSWVGFRTKEIAIELQPRRKGKSKFGTKGLAGLALTGLTAFSDWPLRIWGGIGFILAVLSIICGAWIVLETLIWGEKTPGWSSLAAAIFFLGGVQLISIGVLGEYIGRVFTEVKARPGHIVAERIDFRDERET
jgi:glycosyltransferase involved in cell wall biosynthesis